MKWLAGAGVLTAVIVFAAGCGGSGGGVDPNTGMPNDTVPTVGGDGPVGDSEPPASPSAKPKSYKFDGHGANVNASMFGKRWPLTIKSGRVNCIQVAGGLTVVTFTADNHVSYALNGTARSREDAFDLKEVMPVWADDPQNPGAKKDISVLTDICAPLIK
jgi:hypothetical protein